jgi:hypothetical protein
MPAHRPAAQVQQDAGPCTRCLRRREPALPTRKPSERISRPIVRRGINSEADRPCTTWLPSRSSCEGAEQATSPAIAEGRSGVPQHPKVKAPALTRRSARTSSVVVASPGLRATAFSLRLRGTIVETMIADGRIEAQRYELRDIGSGNWAYMLKPEERGSEYPAWLCPTCFAQGLKGFLHFIAKLRGAGSIYRCSQCKSHTMVQGGPRWL